MLLTGASPLRGLVDLRSAVGSATTGRGGALLGGGGRGGRGGGQGQEGEQRQEEAHLDDGGGHEDPGTGQRAGRGRDTAKLARRERGEREGRRGSLEDTTIRSRNSDSIYLHSIHL